MAQLQKWFSVLPIEIKSNGKLFTEDFSKCSTLKEINTTKAFFAMKFVDFQTKQKKQVAVRIETLIQKSNSLITHDYKNTKITEILLMTLTPQLRKISVEKSALHPSSLREIDIQFSKLVDKLEQAEVTLNLQETENLKLQNESNVQTTTLHKSTINKTLITNYQKKNIRFLNTFENNPSKRQAIN